MAPQIHGLFSGEHRNCKGRLSILIARRPQGAVDPHLKAESEVTGRSQFSENASLAQHSHTVEIAAGSSACP